MSSQTYSEGIRRAYQGETVGERLYRRLAERSDNAQHRAMLTAIADVEELTRSNLVSIAVRLGLTPSETKRTE